MRRLFWVLALFGLFGVMTLTCLARNELMLPADHWSYEAMSELSRDGLIGNFPQRDKQNVEILTRYEMAYYLKTLLAGLEQAKTVPQLTYRQVKLLRELLVEFKNELQMLGVNIADLGGITPSLRLEQQSGKDDGYFDLDVVLASDFNADSKSAVPSSFNLTEPYYFMGEYFSPDLKQNVFFFSPEAFLDPKVQSEFKINSRWDILYNTGDDAELVFIVLKGTFPIGSQKVEGYYFFPLDDIRKNIKNDLEKRVFDLLNLLSRDYEVNNLWQFKGSLPFSKALDKEIYEKWRMTNGLQIGEFLISTRAGDAADDWRQPAAPAKTFADIDDWLNNPFSVEKPFEIQKNLLFTPGPVWASSNDLPDWANLIGSASSSGSPFGPDASFNLKDFGLPGLGGRTWDDPWRDKWSWLMYSFQLLSESPLFSDQSLLF